MTAARPDAGAAPTPLVVSDDLSRHYAVRRGWLQPKAIVRALHGVSFTLVAGRTLGVVGESGCGKSTLARLVTMIEAPTAGRLLLEGRDMAKADATRRKAARPLVQMVFQNPYGSLNPRKRIGTMLEEPLAINTSLSAAERRERAHAAMAKVGLRPEHYGRFPHMFSGGQRQRVAVARALMLSPKLVVADEPVSALDVSIQAQVVNLLKDLQSRLGLTYLFIAHDLAVVKHMADRVAVMYLGKLVEIAPKQSLFANPRHPYTRMLLDAIPRPQPGAQPQRQPAIEPAGPAGMSVGCRFHPRCPFAIERCRVEEPALSAAEPGHLAACHRQHELAPWAAPAAGEHGTSVTALRLALYAQRKAANAAPEPRQGS